MIPDIFKGLRYIGAFLLAFVLPLVVCVVIFVDVPALVPFILCPPSVAAAAWLSAGREPKVTKWVAWGAVIGLAEAILIVALN